MRKLLILFLIVSSMVLWAMENEFLMHELTNVYQEGMEISSLDFDGDGDFDLLTAGTDCQLWINDGSGSFTAETVYPDADLPRSIRAANLDNDDDMDIVIAELQSNRVVVLENIGTIYNQINLTDVTMPHTIDLKDINGDGLVDIIASEFNMTATASEIIWWQNLGDMEFSDGIPITDIFQQSPYVFADYINSDEYIDIVASGELNSDVVWWANDGEQHFGEGIYIDEFFDRAHTIIPNDLDQDGDIDILGAACMGGLLSWWENDGEGYFLRHDVDNFGGALWMDAADFDNDDDKDLFATGQGADFIMIYENNGDEEFTEYPLSGEFDDGFSATSGDLDNDGDIDIAAIGRSSGQVCWWENLLYSVQFNASPQSGHYPLEVQFSDESVLIDSIISWEWDFDNDGEIDSTEEDPVFVCQQEGFYTVSLTITTASMVKTLTMEDLIHVFSGESALLFEGSENLLLPATPDLNFNMFTWESWFTLNSYGSVNNIGFGRFFDKGSCSLYLIESSAGFNEESVVFEFENSTGDLIRCNTPEHSVDLGYWQHIAVTYDGIDQVKIYIDGSEQLLSCSIPPVGAIADNSDIPLIMGNSQNLVWGFCGVLDEIRLWDDVRTWIEISDKMFYHLTGYEENLRACWELNEGNGEYAFDIAGDPDNTLVNGAEWVEGMELITAAEDDNIIPDNQATVIRTYPNPFNPETSISFTLTCDEKVKLMIYNTRGQKVRDLHNGNLSSGKYNIIWNGENDKNMPVSGGIYFYKLEIGQRTCTGKMTLLK